jgi:hypothetical protein
LCGGGIGGIRRGQSQRPFEQLSDLIRRPLHGAQRPGQEPRPAFEVTYGGDSQIPLSAAIKAGPSHPTTGSPP